MTKNMVKDKAWTDEKLAKLKELWELGHSISFIGEKLGVTRNSIAGKAFRLKFPKRQSPIVSKRKASEKESNSIYEIDTELPLRLALRKIKWSRSKCVWPSGDPKTTDFSFCGEPILPGKPYCFKHCEMAYTTSRDG